MPTQHPNEPKCETCRFWHQHDMRRNFGSCFRYPPRSKWGRDFDNNEIEHERPKTCKWDYCGEHKKKSQPTTSTAGQDEDSQQGQVQSGPRLAVGANGQHSEQADTLHDALSQMVGWAEDGAPDEGRQFVLTEARSALKGFHIVQTQQTPGA